MSYAVTPHTTDTQVAIGDRSIGLDFNTVYQAPSDGFVIADGGFNDWLEICYDESSATPDPIGSQFGYTGAGCHICQPVKSGSYYEVNEKMGSGTNLWFIPLEA